MAEGPALCTQTPLPVERTHTHTHRGEGGGVSPDRTETRTRIKAEIRLDSAVAKLQDKGPWWRRAQHSTEDGFSLQPNGDKMKENGGCVRVAWITATKHTENGTCQAETSHSTFPQAPIPEQVPLITPSKLILIK